MMKMMMMMHMMFVPVDDHYDDKHYDDDMLMVTTQAQIANIRKGSSGGRPRLGDKLASFLYTLFTDEW